MLIFGHLNLENMRKVLVYTFFFVLLVAYPSANIIGYTEPTTICDYSQLYSDMQLEGVINYTAFEQAIEGYNKIDVKRKDIITLIDYSKPSTEKRFYVLDLRQKRLLFSSYVSHGKNSGDNFATSFSNKNGSNKSSLGFYVTENTYQGKNGYSLVINGLEKGINDRAKERAIVIHGAPYSDPSVIPSLGRLGRSQGCPALPEAVHKSIINTIKGGTLLYIYADSKNYIAQSKVLSGFTASL